MNQQSAIIIGAGLGGLFLGSILAKEGLQVTVVEKNATIGGGLQSFKRFGQWFDTGMHVVGGMRDGGNIRRICQYLGILDKVDVAHVDNDCSDELHFAEDNQTYRISSGSRERFVSSIAAYFPHEEEGIRAYVDAIFYIADSINLFNLRPFEGFGEGIGSAGLESADQFIARYVSDRRLRSVLAYMNPLYGGRADCTPVYIHAIIQVLYIKGASRFVGGSYRFADALADVIRSHGGEVITNDAVTAINVADKRVSSVDTASGRHLEADWYVSAIHPDCLLRIITPGAFTPAYRRRVESIPNSFSAFSLYIKFRPDTFPYLNKSVYYMSEYDKIWHFDSDDSDWPLGFLFMTPPEPVQGHYADKALVTAPMRWSEVERWADTSVGRRGDDYLEWKQRQARKLIKAIEEIYPDIADCIEDVEAASPLTIRDYYGSKEGCISGFSRDYHDMARSHLPVVTKVRNLLLTGQCCNLHGFCGVPLTAINTAEAILGLNYVVNKINEADS